MRKGINLNMERMDRKNALALSELYKSQLFEIMDEWAAHAADRTYGGYITNFDEHWNTVSREKNTWAQARMTYMYAALYDRMDKNQKWLDTAKCGRDFLVRHAYAGQGRWNYSMTEDGQEVLQGTKALFSDMFALSALSQYARAAGNSEDIPLIEESFLALCRNIADPDFKDIFPHQWEAGVELHSIYMIAINALGTASQVLGKERTGAMIRFCMDKLLYFFSNNRSGYLLESLHSDGTIRDCPEGRLVNPGHILEGMWFCIDEARKTNDRKSMERALAIIEKTAPGSIDPEYGGIIHRFDCFGNPSGESIMTDTGLLSPRDKVDWVNSESLYAFALAAVLSGGEEATERFCALHHFCQSHFRPGRGGDWYPVLNPDGSPLRKNKGGVHRVAFHVPRALMNLSLLFKDAAAYL